eukprot:1136833-Amphidinium_carterae.1
MFYLHTGRPYGHRGLCNTIRVTSCAVGGVAPESASQLLQGLSETSCPCVTKSLVEKVGAEGPTCKSAGHSLVDM